MICIITLKTQKHHDSMDFSACYFAKAGAMSSHARMHADEGPMQHG